MHLSAFQLPMKMGWQIRPFAWLWFAAPSESSSLSFVLLAASFQFVICIRFRLGLEAPISPMQLSSLILMRALSNEYWRSNGFAMAVESARANRPDEGRDLYQWQYQ